MKERIRDILNSFFITVTLINLAMLILGKLLEPDQVFGYEAFMYPLIYGLIGTIPSIVIRDKKELSVKQELIRKVMNMLLIIVLMLAFMFGGREITSELIAAAVGVAISIVIIFVLVNLIIWWLDLKTAKDMTEDLLKYQEKQENAIR
ncbi:Protein of unknown function [Butyrivibrio fibrisolvens DSM 3071]|uniref:DUF3021 domain-containing protein n=2 Tax=Butyrivibrio fibrisolvens TaxID=831 RepID=A0A1M6GGM1_BUTFI|nr:DUF3021 family protein [Butyrivibrio fibrisolvens]SHJ09124.1 Protein of unknown function [Butyrivibrio fibrisolvens DSM 3071]